MAEMDEVNAKIRNVVENLAKAMCTGYAFAEPVPQLMRLVTLGYLSGLYRALDLTSDCPTVQREIRREIIRQGGPDAKGEEETPKDNRDQV